MAITTLDQYIASQKQVIPWGKTGALTTIANMFFSSFDIAGFPGAGTLAGSSAASGVVHTDALAGYPAINAFQGGAKGYVSRLEFGSSVACRIALYDRLYVAGAYNFNASQTLSVQPSWSSRVPGGTDFTGLELWYEQVTAGTGVQSVAVTYTDQDGNAGATTGTVVMPAAFIKGRCAQLPLASGDSGLTKIETVTGTVATVGQFNINVLRPLCSVRVPYVNAAGVLDMLGTGLPEIYADSALYALVSCDSTALGIPDLLIEIANG